MRLLPVVLASSALLLTGCFGARAASLTPPNLTAATTIASGDLFLVWPVASGGPLQQLQYSVLKTNLISALGASYLQVSNNLSDVASFASARSNLGLGSAATVATGTAGGTLCLLNTSCTWSGSQIFTGEVFTAASTTTNAGLNIAPGVAPTSPVNGDCWLTASAVNCRVAGVTQTFLAASNNLSDVSTPATARTNLGLGGAATLSVGTTAGTVAAGDDSRITGAAQKSANLSDVSSPATARTNLGVAYGTAAGTVAQGNDSRFAGPTQNSQSAGYTLVLGDAGGQVYHPSADVTARTWVIPANTSVAYAIGTKIELVNDCSAGALTVNITTDTLVWFPSGTVGSGRTIAACGVASLTKIGATRWALWGTGVS